MRQRGDRRGSQMATANARVARRPRNAMDVLPLHVMQRPSEPFLLLLLFRAVVPSLCDAAILSGIL
jgi:hypothetical protein